MNAAAPIEAQLMLSHNWAEDLTECAEALNTHCRRSDLAASTPVWFCLFSNYQAGDEEGDVGPTVAEQLAMDPFGHVIRSAREHRGMLVIHTSRAEVYDRLWCVYEIATALREDCTMRSTCSRRYADTGRRRLQNVLDVNTTNAKCSCTMDEAFICDRVNNTGGFERLDKEIFQFRVSMLMEQAEEAGQNRLQSLTKAITKVEKRLELENSSSSSIDSWVSKLGAHRGFYLMLAFLALGGVAVAAFVSYQNSQDILTDVSTTPAVATTTPSAIPPTTTPAVVTTTSPPPPPPPPAAAPTPAPGPTPPVVTTTTPAVPTPGKPPDNGTTVSPPIVPPPYSTTTGYPDYDSSNGGQSTTDADEQDPVYRMILIGVAAMFVLLVLPVLLILLLRRLGRCSRQSGVDQGMAEGSPRQTLRRVQLERLELMRQMVEARVQELDRQPGFEAV
jgi:hypothetical protein